MATKRRRGNSYEYVVKRRGLLPGPLSISFPDEAEGDRYIANLELFLDQGQVPPEFLDRSKRSPNRTLGQVLAEYRKTPGVSQQDLALLPGLQLKLGTVALTSIDFAWAQAWVHEMKLRERLAPGTIRHRVGAIARALDWAVSRKLIGANPLRSLRRGYSQYTSDERKATDGGRDDQERDRRLEPGEHERLLAAIAQGEHSDEWRLLYTLAIETAMRLRELYTLTWGQVDLQARTVFLVRTKNGSTRQVPLSSVALKALSSGKTGSRRGRVFPSLYDGQTPLATVTGKLSRAWARIARAAGANDLRFHDLRHEATSRLFERTTLRESEIQRITGHKSVRMLNRYANLRASDLAGSLW